MNDKIYNIVVKEYSKFIKPNNNNNNTDLGTYYNLYDDKFNFNDKFNFIQKLQKSDLQSILTKYNIKYNNLRFHN